MTDYAHNLTITLALTGLANHLRNDPVFQACLTEAVHRYYYDNVNTGFDPRHWAVVNNIHQTLIGKNTDWRLTINNRMKRYDDGKDKVKWMPIDSKSAEILDVQVDLYLKR